MAIAHPSPPPQELTDLIDLGGTVGPEFLIDLENRIMYRYRRLASGKGDLVDAAEIAKCIVIYEDFHDAIGEMSDDRMSDFSKSAKRVGKMLDQKGDPFFEAWAEVLRAASGRVTFESPDRVPPLAYLSNLTWIHDRPSTLEYESRDFSRIPSVP